MQRRKNEHLFLGQHGRAVWDAMDSVVTSRFFGGGGGGVSGKRKTSPFSYGQLGACRKPARSMTLTSQQLDVESGVAAVNRNVSLIDPLVPLLDEAGSPAPVRQTVKLVQAVLVGRIVVPSRLFFV